MEHDGFRVNEKQMAIEKIIDLTLTGIVSWERDDDVWTTVYSAGLENKIEIISHTEKRTDGLTFTQVTISNENGKIVINNGDMTRELHMRLLNVVRNNLKESNVLTDFI